VNGERDTEHVERRTANVERPDSDTPMTKTYVGVLVLEAVIIAALFFLGRLFA
jgi:hypothetical protein